VVFVSHFLNEIMQICDEVSVLRDGQLVDEFDAAGMSVERMVSGIVGNRLHAVEAFKPAHAIGEVVLDVRGLRSTSMGSVVDLEVRRGEIVGIAGLLGSGRTSLLKAIFGADRRVSGEVIVNGESISASPERAVAGGVAFVPEDRLSQGLIADWEIWRNTALADSRELSVRTDRYRQGARAGDQGAKRSWHRRPIDRRRREGPQWRQCPESRLREVDLQNTPRAVAR
jgi:ribose transport system ATP-binding protein